MKDAGEAQAVLMPQPASFMLMAMVALSPVDNGLRDQAGISVYVALGSNLGDRGHNIQSALTRLDAVAPIVRTSFLYETAPAYIVDQPAFLNAVVEVRTTGDARTLLHALQEIERGLGRTRTVKYGPREIDLDILFYGQEIIESEELVVPHPRMLERDFVLQPLCDLAPDMRHLRTGQTMLAHLQALPAACLPKVTPLPGPATSFTNDNNQPQTRLWRWDQKTYIMGILNVTPDSFSGDGLLADGDLARALDAALIAADEFQAAGADCLDIGAHSTRPGHKLLPAQEEIDRILPFVEALAKHTALPLSIDTFRAPVAQAALGAGAHLINDVWSSQFDPDVAHVAARHGCPLVLMHNRMPDLDPAYPVALRDLAAQPLRGDVATAIAADLSALASQAQTQGVRRWQLILDPGMGFGKNVDQHLELVRHLDELTALGYPLLFGPSRKRLIGYLLGGVPPTERVEGTIALCILAMTRGANFLRVHDVQAVARAATVADAVLRPYEAIEP